MAYNPSVARGWESKAVEDQMDAAQADKAAQQTPTLTLDEREQRARKQSLLLSRSRTVSLLELARNERYRSQLKRTLEHLDEQLRELEKAEGS
jgi:predicted Zn-dependent peptidase